MSDANRKPARRRRAPTKKSLASKIRKLSKRAYKSFRKIPLGIDALGVLLLVVTLYQARFSLVPAIQPDPAISSSWEDLPMIAHNSGSIFDLKDAHFFCDVTNITHNGNETTAPWSALRVVGAIEWPVQRTTPEILPGTSVTFPCNISKDWYMTVDGAKLPIALIHMRIRTTYAVNLWLFHWHREAISQVFTWRHVSGGFQWLEGDTSDAIK